MAAFCTVADLVNFLQITIAADNPAALAAIAEATAAIQNYCRQTISLAEDDEYTFDVGERQTKLKLPELPVTEIAEVVEDEETLTADDDYKLGLYGILHRVNAFWVSGVQTVTVTYSHGYATIPDTVKDVCKRAAARTFQAGLKAEDTDGVLGVQGMSLGDYSITYGSEAGAGSSGSLGASAAPMLLPSERRMLDRYKLRGA